MGRKKTKEQFVNTVEKIHNYKYNYDKVIYEGNKKKVCIICPVHGEFYQRPDKHLYSGCYKCGNEYLGKIRIENCKRSKILPTSIQLPPNSKAIPLTQGKYAIIDEEDYQRTIKHNWTLAHRSHTDYAANYTTECILLHRFIMKLSKLDKVMVDHINHNGLDNRKCNLRLCSNQENARNTTFRKNVTSKYKGVSWDKSRNKWLSYIRINGKNRYLGRYINEEEAARAYDAKAKELFGEFGYLNFK